MVQLVGITTFANSPLQTWLGAKGYCKPVPDEYSDTTSDALAYLHEADPFRAGTAGWYQVQLSAAGLELTPNATVWCVSAWDLWCATYYWMMQLISGVRTIAARHPEPRGPIGTPDPRARCSGRCDAHGRARALVRKRACAPAEAVCVCVWTCERASRCEFVALCACVC